MCTVRVSAGTAKWGAKELTITVGSMVKARRIHDMILDNLPQG
jgi:hypothetical protein